MVRLSQMRVCDGEPNNTSGLGQRPSHRPRRIAHTLRPGAFPSLIVTRIAHPAPNRNYILITCASSRRRSAALRGAAEARAVRRSAKHDGIVSNAYILAYVT